MEPWTKKFQNLVLKLGVIATVTSLLKYKKDKNDKKFAFSDLFVTLKWLI